MSSDQQEGARETPRQRFVRLANKRVVKAIRAIQLVGNLSSPACLILIHLLSEPRII
jgi:hypothetical protein